MFEDLIEKLKASIEELKKKLPGKKGDDEDEYEEDEEDYEEKYHGDDDAQEDDGKTVKVQITDLLQEGTGEKTEKIVAGKKDEDEDEDDEEDEEDVDAKAQKRKKIIIYGSVAAIVVLLAWDQIFPPEPEIPTPAPIAKKKRKKRKFPKKAAPPQEVAGSVVAGDKETVKAETPKSDSKEVKEATALDIKVAEVPPETAVGLPTEESKKDSESQVVDESKDEMAKPAEESPSEDMKVVTTDSSESVNSDVAQPKEKGLNAKMGEDKKDDLGESVQESSKSKEGLESKIDKKLEYVAPPNYERLGRGLVYNCVGRHWACVDKFSYLTCRENSVWSGQNNKKPECVIKNVYASTEDCSVIQKHYIESSEPTSFCEGAKEESEQRVEETTNDDAQPGTTNDSSSSESETEDDLKLLE